MGCLPSTQLLHVSLKRERIVPSTPEHVAMLDPFVSILATTIKSKHAPVGLHMCVCVLQSSVSVSGNQSTHFGPFPLHPRREVILTVYNLRLKPRSYFRPSSIYLVFTFTKHTLLSRHSHHHFPPFDLQVPSHQSLIHCVHIVLQCLFCLYHH